MKKMQKNLEEIVKVTDDERGIVLSFSEYILFDPGSVALNEDVIPLLDAIATAIQSSPNNILIMTLPPA